MCAILTAHDSQLNELDALLASLAAEEDYSIDVRSMNELCTGPPSLLGLISEPGDSPSLAAGKFNQMC